MSIFELKLNAKSKLGNDYLKAVLGALVCYIPAYIMTLITNIFAISNVNAMLVTFIALLSEVFVLDIFSVGYFRSLTDLNNQPDGDEKNYDINLVLSGFSTSYKNTLKTMFLRRLYIFGWSCLMVLPIGLGVGIISFLTIRTETAQLITLITHLIQSPTFSMAQNVITYIAENCAYVIYILGGAVLLSILLTIPYVRKVYEYEMIPLILAENPDMGSCEAFIETKKIMSGYRLTYFFLQLSFLGLIIIASLVTSFIPLGIITYIILAFIMPYMNMTFIQFYIKRKNSNKETTERNE